MMNIRSILARRKRLLISSCAWAGVLAVLALQPAKVVHHFLPYEIMQNFTHAAAYGILSFLLFLYFRFKRHIGQLKMTDRVTVVLATLITLFWGGFTEVLQVWSPDRVADVYDLVWDGLGAFTGTLVCMLYTKLPRHSLFSFLKQ